MILETLESKGLFIMNYPNFGKEIIFQKIIIGWKKYLGIGLRHIVMIVSRSWNIANNPLY
jgi:hypothetical protein